MGLFSSANAVHLKPWLVKSLEPMFVLHSYSRINSKQESLTHMTGV